ncbi:DNA cytosine methyltransferase [Planobispora rosea]|uniref:DNA cytosine methyltransferase n=1 Tax=Planobispora rosea TaxID=35762 RepID=UPI00083B8D3A|nr:DNA cytosine methyltransferase [Planobispora rosea]
MKAIGLFAGPGGFDMGARILGLPEAHGYDIDTDACATATAAGFTRTLASVRDLDPDSMRGVTGAIITPPCPTFSASGKQTGVDDLPHILEAITHLGNSQAGMGPDDAWAEVYAKVQDVRSALVVEAARFALRLPHLQWLVCEQVPAVTPIWQEMCAELAGAHDFTACFVLTVCAEDLGLPSRRTRTFVIATRHRVPDLTGLPIREGWACGRFVAPVNLYPDAGAGFPAVTMAGALGWPAGERVNTRGNRKTPGGNEFPADGLSWCLTEKIRSWKRTSDGAKFTPAQAGLLVGFPADYPWQGSPSKCFLQAADVVSPPVAAAVLGAALCLDWERPVRDYLAELYPAGASIPRPIQPSLFEAVA